MNWQNIKVSADNTHFLFEGKQIFEKHFVEVLKFHSPGIAPVFDNTGAYHIDITGQAIYSERYTRTFGCYCNRAAVTKDGEWFHLNESGHQVYSDKYAWTGNYQENLCTVRDRNGMYFHIDLSGKRVYPTNCVYAGDYKDGVACIKSASGFYRHIDTCGNPINRKEFLDLGVFHKNFATAQEGGGWFHINRKGDEIYSQRYQSIEPFYNGFALVTKFDGQKVIIDESGIEIIVI